MKEFISFEEARNIVIGQAHAGSVNRIPLAETLGNTLAETISSRDPFPPFDNTAMDGYAVRVSDLAELPRLLSVVEEIPAGSVPTKHVVSGTCSRIMTGAPVPEGADAIVPVEWTRSEAADSESVIIEKAPMPGEHIRKAGEDLRPNEEVIQEGTVVTPAVIGLLATLGAADVLVRERPNVSILVTGDELLDPSSELTPGKIRNSNGPALGAQVIMAGASVFCSEVAGDDSAILSSAFDRIPSSDILLISGGVSVGKYDLVKEVLLERGLELFFWKVRQRPGKPLMFGRIGETLVFGLPGNPVSSSVCFEQYVRPAIARMLGRRQLFAQEQDAILTNSTHKKRGLYYFSRGSAYQKVDGKLYVDIVKGQGSHRITGLMRANCLVHFPESLQDPPAGTPVKIQRLPW